MSLFRNETIATPRIIGVLDGSTAVAGNVGEVVSSLVPIGSAVPLTTATAANVTSISLTPGDWDIFGSVNFSGNSSSIAASGSAWTIGVNTTSATLPTDGSEAQMLTAVSSVAFKSGENTGRKVLNITTTTTVYLVALATFTAGAVVAYGALNARRIR